MSIRSAIIWFFAVVVITACASTEVTKRQRYDGERLPRPERIIIHDFTANPAEVPPGSSFADHTAGAVTPTADQLAVTRKLGSEVAKELVAKLSDAGLPAVRAAGQPAPAINDIVIRGYFVSVDQGSAAERVLVGFGAGDAKLMTAVEG